eukprot:1146558-Pelagomonas_calceolata.AAC.7
MKVAPAMQASRMLSCESCKWVALADQEGGRHCGSEWHAELEDCKRVTLAMQASDTLSFGLSK